MKSETVNVPRFFFFFLCMRSIASNDPIRFDSDALSCKDNCDLND